MLSLLNKKFPNILISVLTAVLTIAYLVQNGSIGAVLFLFACLIAAPLFGIILLGQYTTSIQKNKKRIFKKGFVGDFYRWSRSWLSDHVGETPQSYGRIFFWYCLGIGILEAITGTIHQYSIPTAVFLLIILRFKQIPTSSKFSRPALAMLTAFVTSAIIFFGRIELLRLFTSLNTGPVDVVNLISPSAIAILSIALLLLFVASQYPPVGIGVKVFLTGTIFGALLSLSLTYPVFTWVFANYTPGLFVASKNHDLIFLYCLISSVVIGLLFGPAVLWWAKPSTFLQKLLLGAITGGITGGYVFGFLGGSASGIIAQTLLLPIAITREGFAGNTWIYRIAIAINNVIPSTFVGSWLLIGSGIIVGVLSVLLIPIPSKWQKQALIPSWKLLLSELTWPGILIAETLNFIVISATYVTLQEKIQNTFNPLGVTPSPSPFFILEVILSQHRLLILFIQIIFVLWMYKRLIPYKQNGGDEIVLQSTKSINIFFLVSGLFISGSSFFMQTSPLAQLFSLISLAITFEAFLGVRKLNAITPPKLISDQKSNGGFEEFPEHTNWHGASLPLGFLISILSTQFLFSAVSMALIAIVLIAPMSDATAELLGIEWLKENTIVPLIRVASATFPLILISYMIMSISTRDPFVYSAKTNSSLENATWSIQKYWKWILNFAQKVFQLAVQSRSRYFVYLILLLFGAIVDLSSASLFGFIVSNFLYLLVIFLLTGGEFILRLRTSSILGAFVALYLVLLAPVVQIDQQWFYLICKLVFLFAIVIIVRVMLIYISAKRSIFFRQIFLIGTSIAFVAVGYASQDQIQKKGGVTSFDNQSWTVFANTSDLEESLVGGSVNYKIFQDSQNRLWFASGTGAVIEKQDELWNLYTLNPSPSDKSGSTDLENVHSFFFEDSEKRLWIASGMQLLLLDPEGISNNQSNQDITETSNSLFYIMPKNSAGDTLKLNGSILDASKSPDGDIWLISGDMMAVQFSPADSNTAPSWKIWQLGRNLLSVYADQSGRIWFGTDQGPILLEDQTPRQIEPEAITNSFLSMNFYEDSSGIIWVGTDKGVYLYAPDTATLQLQNGWPERVVSTVFYEDGEGSLWAGTNAGLYQHKKQTWVEILPSLHVTTIKEGPNNSLWVGSEQGLWKYVPTSGSSVLFDSSNSGLTDNWVRDLLIDDQGVLWVSTFRQVTASNGLPWAMLFTGLFFGLLFIFVRNEYEKSTVTRGRRIGSNILENPNQLLPIIYKTISSDQDSPELLNYVGAYLEDKLDSSGAQISRSFANLLEQRIPDLSMIIGSLSKDALREDARSLSSVYEVAAIMIMASNLNEINRMEFTVATSKEGSSIQIFSPRKLEANLPTFIGWKCEKSWQAFEEICVVLRKYKLIGSAIDRLGYLAQALDLLEVANHVAQDTPRPDKIIFHWIGENWRTVIRDEIALISGHSDLRLDLLTRQVRNTEKTTIAIKIQNTGQAIAENIRMLVRPEDSISIEESNPIRLERLSSGQSESIEITIINAKQDHIRIFSELLWDDRQGKDHRYEFADIVRRYETSDKFEHIPNPFIVGHPVKSADLFRGRQDIFEFILQNVSSASLHSRTLVLYGQRRTGKTSILYQLLGGKLGSEYIPVLVDIQELAPSINSTIDLFVELAFHIEKSMHKDGLTAGNTDPNVFNAAPTRAFSRFLDEIEGQLAGKKIVLMFDEFELIEEKISQGKLESEALGYLRSLMQHKDYLVFIFTGTHKLEQMSQDYWSIFFNIALHHKISFMNKIDAINLIREPILGKLSIDDLAVDKIIALTNGHPYFIQLFCWALVNHCNKSERNYATLNDLNDVLKEIISSGDAYFAFIWQLASFDERIIMAALAGSLGQGKSLVPFQEIKDAVDQAGINNFDKSKIIQILDRLVDQEIMMSRGSDKLQYSYRVGLIGEWVKYSKSLQALVERGA